MNVLLVHNSGSAELPSGETVVFQSEAVALRDRGIEVHTWLSQPRKRGLLANFKRINVFSSGWARRQVGDLIEAHHPDIVHVHGVLPDLTTSVFGACRQANVPVVQTLHNYRWLCVEGGLFRRQAFCDDCLTRGRWQGIRHRCVRGSLPASTILAMNNRAAVASGRLFRLVDRFVAVSSFVKKMHLRGQFPDHKLVVKYNGISIPATRQPPDSGDPYVAFAGRLDVAKGTPILQRLPELLPHLKFKIAGAGPAESVLRKSLGGRANVELLGRIDSPGVTRLLATAICTVLPSLVPESFGLVAAESLAAGVPVVASRLGGLQELVGRSQGGVTVDLQDGAKGFADAIRTIAESTAERERMSSAGRAFAESKLSLTKTTDELIAIYEDVIANRQLN